MRLFVHRLARAIVVVGYRRDRDGGFPALRWNGLLLQRRLWLPQGGGEACFLRT